MADTNADETGVLKLEFDFPNSDAVVTVLVTGFVDPLHALGALKRAGSEATLAQLLGVMADVVEVDL